MFPGGSTAAGGIVLDLHHLNALELSEDRETAYVGTGNRWGAVYEFLKPWNLTVVGGRVGDVGVGGFLLGGKFIQLPHSVCCEEILAHGRIGGISFISRRYGWGCDNVRNYEVRYSLPFPNKIPNSPLNNCLDRPFERHNSKHKLHLPSRPLLRPSRRRQEFRHRNPLRPRNASQSA